MRVHLERTGGFAGIRTATTIDSETLNPAEAQQMQRLVEAARFFDLPEALPESVPGADRFQYKVTVETQGRRHSVTIPEGAMTPDIRRLLDWLKQAPAGASR